MFLPFARLCAVASTNQIELQRRGTCVISVLLSTNDAANDCQKIGEVSTESTLIHAIDSRGEAVGRSEGDEGVLDELRRPRIGGDSGDEGRRDRLERLAFVKNDW